MSERTSIGASVNCSGLAKAGVPTNPPCVKPIASGFSTSAFATPKSITFTTVSAFSALPGLESSASGAAATNIKFAGFKSRCTRPCFSAADKQGLVHRDLKPANLMLVAAAPDADDSSPGKAEKAETVVKVIDFGVAKALVEKPDAMGLTHGGFVGTPAFASPEQFTDAQVEVRSDIYSLGATLWYVLTGNRPFQGTTIEQIRASQCSRALPIEQLKAARVPSKLVSLLVSMLALAPAARPGIRELKKQLQECSFQILDRWKIVRRFALAAALVALVIVAAVLLF